jgi:hypothetical protein
MQVINEKPNIANILQEWYNADASQYQWAIADLEWPSLDDCIFIAAPVEYTITA